MSTYELARKLDMNQPVVWRFKTKVMLAMKSSGKYPIDGAVAVDETMIGGKVKSSAAEVNRLKNR